MPFTGQTVSCRPLPYTLSIINTSENTQKDVNEDKKDKKGKQERKMAAEWGHLIAFVTLFTYLCLHLLVLH